MGAVTEARVNATKSGPLPKSVLASSKRHELMVRPQSAITIPFFILFKYVLLIFLFFYYYFQNGALLNTSDACCPGTLLAFLLNSDWGYNNRTGLVSPLF